MNTHTETGKKRWKRYLAIGLAVLIGLGGFTAWYKLFRVVPQPEWIDADPVTRFKYGSIGGEQVSGLPYWIFIVLPRMFPEYLPGNGGYASLGVPWEEGKDMPVGFTKMTIGFPRVGNNCAVCHTAIYRESETSKPVFEVTGPGHTSNVEGFFKFIIDCAKDPRFNADNILEEIAMVHELSFLDKLIYRFALIPITKKRLLEREEQFAWLYRDDFDDWGKGRDDGMNLTKYFMIGEPMDDTFGPADLPPIWNLRKYDGDDTTMNWDGATYDAYSVVIDSALGVIGGPPHDNDAFLEEVDWLLEYLRNKQAPKWPFELDEGLAQKGSHIFAANCARCHDSERTLKSVPLSEVGTSSDRLDTWNKQAAIKANKVVEEMGIKRKGLVEETLTGYLAVRLDGIWLRAPYLHNGSVPSLVDLLSPVESRPVVFYKGYDVYDKKRVGFVTTGPEAQRHGTKLDTRLKGNHNFGHTFGTELADEDKQALIEYLKTL